MVTSMSKRGPKSERRMAKQESGPAATQVHRAGGMSPFTNHVLPVKRQKQELGVSAQGGLAC